MGSSEIDDPVLDEMAGELRTALIDRGLDPENPPSDGEMPAQRAFEEYLRRGGTVYTEEHDLAFALVKKVAGRE